MIGHSLSYAGSLIAYVSAVLYLLSIAWVQLRGGRAEADNANTFAARAGRLVGKHLLEIWLGACALIIIGDLLR